VCNVKQDNDVFLCDNTVCRVQQDTGVFVWW